MQESTQANRSVLTSVPSPFLTSGISLQSVATGLPHNKMGTETDKGDRNTPEYLAQLLKDKKQIAAFPNVFIHMERLLDDGEYKSFILLGGEGSFSAHLLVLSSVEKASKLVHR